MSRRVATVLVPLGSLLALFGLWGVDLLTWLRARNAPVAAIPDPPNLGWSLGVIAAGLLLAMVCAFGWLRRRGPEFRAYRLPPILLITCLFVELFFFAAERIPLSSSERLQVALRLLAQAASQASQAGQVPRDPAALSRLVTGLGAPAYLVHGAPAGPYRLTLREGCDGPVQEAPGSALGTLFYCVAKDGKSAWVSAVALPEEVTYGSPALYSRGGVVQWVKVTGAPALTPPASDR
jgi:hypothetical protein